MGPIGTYAQELSKRDQHTRLRFPVCEFLCDEQNTKLEEHLSGEDGFELHGKHVIDDAMLTTFQPCGWSAFAAMISASSR
jgi:hypothetical protein